ncbi:hypothetical protein [Pedobacter glucosidilyticus]|uniref:hypothetical protein n=1 Tax=Pedobacter glucosidilyticus TaxID=1122941 RepID=UPI0012DBCD6F|nr:hypothetical protein [Pedobacter glucosidilyticus]
MGIFTYAMAISNFKQKLTAILSNCPGYKQIIRKDVNEYLTENRRDFFTYYQQLIVGFAELRDFERKIIKSENPFEMHILQACCPPEIDTEDLRRRVLNIFLDSLEEAIEKNRSYNLCRRKI